MAKNIKVSTTEKFISSFSGSVSVGTIVETLGYTTEGDGGGASWTKTATTGTASQSPAQLADALLNDASGNQWALVVNDSVMPEQLGATIGSGDNKLHVYACLIASMRKGVFVKLTGEYPISEKITVTTTAGITIKGTSPDKSRILSPNGGILIIQSSVLHSIVIDDIGFIATGNASGTGLEIDGSDTISGGVLFGRTENKALISNVKFSANVAASAFQWDICLHFKSFDKFSVSKILTRGNGTQPSTSIGILMNGDGIMVESYISGWWGYNHINALEVADAHEGLFVNDFNLVAVINGLSLGVETANTIGLTSSLKCLGDVIYDGHINCFNTAISCNLLKTNQSFISNVLCYVNEGSASPTQTTREVVILGSGKYNKINNLSIVTLTPITKSALAPIVIQDNSHGSFSNMSYADGENASLTTSNIIGTGAMLFCNLDIAVDTLDNAFNAVIKIANTTNGNVFSVKSDASFLNGFVSPTSGTIPIGNDYGIDTPSLQNISLTSGAASQSVSIPLQTGKYNQAPSLATAEQTNDLGAGVWVKVIYDKNASSSSALAFKIYPSTSGGTLPTGTITVVSQVLKP